MNERYFKLVLMSVFSLYQIAFYERLLSLTNVDQIKNVYKRVFPNSDKRLHTFITSIYESIVFSGRVLDLGRLDTLNKNHCVTIRFPSTFNSDCTAGSEGLFTWAPLQQFTRLLTVVLGRSSRLLDVITCGLTPSRGRADGPLPLRPPAADDDRRRGQKYASPVPTS